jgi:nitroreductase
MSLVDTNPLTLAELTDCVRSAVAAPSVHNSQPWRFRIRDGGVDVFADRSRQLQVIDPSGRELMISVGAAVFNLRVAVRNQLRVPLLRLSPEPAEPDLVARVTPGRSAPPDRAVAELAAAIPARHTNRLPFARTVIPADVLDRLLAAAMVEGASLAVAGPVGRGAILNLARTAVERFRTQGVYRAELSEWTRPDHGRRDGIPPTALGAWDALEALPMRDFGLTLPWLHRPVERFEPFPTIVVLATDGDTVDDWLRAGQALQHVLLVATIDHLSATPISQPLEIPALRELLTDTRSGRWAQLILRLGYGPPATPTPRRPLAEVLFESVHGEPQHTHEKEGRMSCCPQRSADPTDAREPGRFIDLMINTVLRETHRR